MGKGYETDLNAMKQHAGETHDVGDAVGVAVDAAKQDAAGLVTSFGVVGQVFGAVIYPWVVAADVLLHSAESAAHDMGDRVTDAHDVFAGLEDFAKGTFDGIKGELS